MKHVTVSIADSGILELHGEPMFDGSENTLIIAGDNGTYMQFNWNRVDFFAVQDTCPHEDAGE